MLSPKLSLHAEITEKMEVIKERLKEYEDPEKYASALRKKRNKKKRSAVLRKQARRGVIIKK